MTTETTKALPAPFGFCTNCGRPITHARSNAHSYGPCCWQKHLDSLPEPDRLREAMRGYGWFQAGDLYIVVTPEHTHYQVDIDAPSCECIAFTAAGGGSCKHVLYLRREVGWTAPHASESPQDRQGTAPALTIELLDDHYAKVRDGRLIHRVGWLRPYCTCPAFRQDHEICAHIRAAQNEVNRQAEARRAQAETPEARRARVKAILDEEFDER